MPEESLQRRQMRCGKNQSLFRDVNERIEKVAQEFVTHGPLSFVCECWDAECGVQLELTYAEYEHVRSESVWFVVAPGHESLDVEDVVASNDRFTIVEKIEAAVPIAVSNDRRRSLEQPGS